ncbi:MAG: hypothetical protein ACI9D0_001629 [Bacteroidia bacterium]|jgi:hypothetical protein
MRSVLLCLVAGVLAGTPADFEVQPQPLKWSEITSAQFDSQWALPEARSLPGRDLLAEMRGLLALRFDIKDAEGQRYKSFGDLADAAAKIRSESTDPGAAAKALASWYRGISGAAPKLAADWGGGMEQLLFDQGLSSKDWDPEADTDDDGLLFAAAWNMEKEPGGPWGAIDVTPLMEQGAAVLNADLATIKAVENDYRLYLKHLGEDYEEIFPVEGSYYQGRDAAEQPFSLLALRFTCDLPFPFSDYTTDLKLRNRFDAEQVLYTDIYSTSSDFYWLAGRDVYLPITTTAGDWVGFLLVRHFGFDLDGVPDGADDRRNALRASMGNRKRNAEKRWRERADVEKTPKNQLEELDNVRVFGQK